jgi:hypothetical protein
MRKFLGILLSAAILSGGTTVALAAEMNDGGGDLSTYDKAVQWTEKNPDTWIGIQGGIQNLNGSTPQSNVMQGAGEAVGVGIGQKLNESIKPQK